MKLKFNVIKNGEITNSKVVDETAFGVEWLLKTFPVKEISLEEKLELEKNNGLFLTQVFTFLNKESNPDSLEKYFIPDGWTFSIDDITKEKELETGINLQGTKREKCWKLIDEIGFGNKGKDEAHMDAIFMNPTYVAICIALITGAPTTAKRYILQIGPSLYSPEKVSDIVNKLDAIIASS